MGLELTWERPVPRARYPHMSPVECELWTRFLLRRLVPLERVAYDVRVGPGHVPDGLEEEELRRMARALTQLRIDALGETRDAIWVFEVKYRAGRSALGQLLSYAYWVVRDLAPVKPLRLAVVCHEVDYNMRDVFDARGIWVFQV